MVKVADKSSRDSTNHSNGNRRSNSSSGSLRPKTAETKASSAADLIKNFEREIRKVVDRKRSECDKLQFTVLQKRKALAQVKLLLADVKKESVALGMDEYPDDNDRLQSVPLYSRRRLFSKKTNIRDVEDQLSLKWADTTAVMRKTYTYEHIQRRHEKETYACLQAQQKMSQVLRERQQKIQDLHRMDIMTKEALAHAQARLAQLKTNIAADIRSYDQELMYRQRWAREKKKFQAFYDRQVCSVEMHLWILRDTDGRNLRVVYITYIYIYISSQKNIVEDFRDEV